MDTDNAVIVGRPINGISINGNEYLLGDNGEPMVFSSESAAKDFLRGHGINEFDDFCFEDIKKREI